MGDRVNK